jgi:hypothetical protein
LLYSDKKEEDNIMYQNMFDNRHKIEYGWTDIEYRHNKKIVDSLLEKEEVDEVIFASFEVGFDRLAQYIKKRYKLPIKVICNTQDSLLYYEYERAVFIRILELSQEGIIDCIAFLRKGQYETYKSLGYNAYYLKENLHLDGEYKKENNKSKKTNIGIYPLCYTWDKNVFNQLCLGQMVDNCVINYNNLDERMDDFLTTMKIENRAKKVDFSIESIAEAVKSDDIVVSCSFTEYFHPVFFVSMEMGIPCLVGNNVDFLDDKYLNEMIVTKAEDDPIINSRLVANILKNKEAIMKAYKAWKKRYDVEAKKNLEEFIEM